MDRDEIQANLFVFPSIFWNLDKRGGGSQKLAVYIVFCAQKIFCENFSKVFQKGEGDLRHGPLLAWDHDTIM